MGTEGGKEKYQKRAHTPLLDSKTKSDTIDGDAPLLTRKRQQYFLVRVRRSIGLYTGYC